MKRPAQCPGRSRQQHTLANHQLEHVAAARAQRHADADFLSALLHGVGHQAVDSDGGQQQREPAKMVSSSILKFWRAVESEIT